MEAPLSLLPFPASVAPRVPQSREAAYPTLSDDGWGRISSLLAHPGTATLTLELERQVEPRKKQSRVTWARESSGDSEPHSLPSATPRANLAHFHAQNGKTAFKINREWLGL